MKAWNRCFVCQAGVKRREKIQFLKMIIKSDSNKTSRTSVNFCFDNFKDFNDNFRLTRHIDFEHTVVSQGFAAIEEAIGARDFTKNGFLELSLYTCNDHRDLTKEFLMHISDLHLEMKNKSKIMSLGNGNYVKKGLINKLDDIKREKLDGIEEKIFHLHIEWANGEKSPTDNISKEIELFTLEETSSIVSKLAESVLPSKKELLEKLCSRPLPSPIITIKDSVLIKDILRENYFSKQEEIFDEISRSTADKLLHSLNKIDSSVFVVNKNNTAQSFPQVLETLIEYIADRIYSFYVDYLSLSNFISVNDLINCIQIYQQKTDENPILFPTLDEELIKLVRSCAERHELDLSDETISRKDVVEDFITKADQKIKNLRLMFSDKDYVEQDRLEKITILDEVSSFLSGSIKNSASQMGIDVPDDASVAELQNKYESELSKSLKKMRNKAKNYGFSVAKSAVKSAFKFKQEFEKELATETKKIISEARGHKISLPQIDDLSKLQQMFQNELNIRKSKVDQLIKNAEMYQLPMAGTSERDLEKLESMYEKEYEEAKNQIISEAKSQKISLTKVADLSKLRLNYQTELEHRASKVEQILDDARRHKLPMAGTSERDLEKLESMYKQEYADAKNAILPSVKDIGINVTSKTDLATLQDVLVRESKRDSYIKSGIPSSIIDAYVKLKISKDAVLRIARFLGKKYDSKKFEKHILIVLGLDKLGEWHSNHFMYHNGEPTHRINGELIEYMVEKLDQDKEVFDYALMKGGKGFSSDDFDFLLRCKREAGLKVLFESIYNHGFDFVKAKSMIIDWGLDKYPEALQRVIDGADLELISAMYGIYQL